MGSQVEPCQCGCQASGLSPHRLAEKGLFGLWVQNATDLSGKVRVWSRSPAPSLPIMFDHASSTRAQRSLHDPKLIDLVNFWQPLAHLSLTELLYPARWLGKLDQEVSIAKVLDHLICDTHKWHWAGIGLCCQSCIRATCHRMFDGYMGYGSDGGW